MLIASRLLARLGGMVGATIAWLSCNGQPFSTGGSFGQFPGHLHVSAPPIAAGMAWAATPGFPGVHFPAIYSPRMPVADALRMS
jgi:putative ABC transport system permease protein